MKRSVKFKTKCIKFQTQYYYQFEFNNKHFQRLKYLFIQFLSHYNSDMIHVYSIKCCSALYQCVTTNLSSFQFSN